MLDLSFHHWIILIHTFCLANPFSFVKPDGKIWYTCSQNLLNEIIAGLRNVSTETASSSSVPTGISAPQSVSDLLSDIAPIASAIVGVFHLQFLILH